MELLNLMAIDTSQVTQICTKAKDVVQLIGYILLIFKVAIPLVIVALGAVDFAKAVIAEKEDEIKKQTKRLIYRIIAGVVIFLVPNIIVTLFGFVSSYDDDQNAVGFAACEECFLNPGGNDCLQVGGGSDRGQAANGRVGN